MSNVTNRRMLALALAVGMTFPALTPVTAADVDWTRRIRTLELDSAGAVAVDPSGITVVGATRGPLHGANRGGDDAFVRRYDLQGNLLWGRQFGSSAFDFAGDVDAGANSIAVVGHLDGKGFVRRYTTGGRLMWARTLATSAPVAVAISGSGIYITGPTPDADALPRDVFLRRYRLDGTLAWTRFARGPEDESARGVAVDQEGVTILWGAQRGSDAPPPTWDAAIRRYDLDATVVWGRRFGDGSGRLWASDIAADATGLSFVATARDPERDMTDAQVRRFGRNGDRLWTRTFGGMHGGGAAAVDADASGISVAGWLHQGPSVDDPQTGFVRRYSFSGRVQWTEHLPAEPYRVINGVAAGGGADVIAGDQRVSGDDWDGWVRRYVR